MTFDGLAETFYEWYEKYGDEVRWLHNLREGLPKDSTGRPLTYLVASFPDRPYLGIFRDGDSVIRTLEKWGVSVVTGEAHECKSGDAHVWYSLSDGKGHEGRMLWIQRKEANHDPE